MNLRSVPGTPVQKETDRLFAQLQKHETSSDEYSAILDQIIKLHETQADLDLRKVKPDTMVLAGTNLVGILMILFHERVNVITTKAMSTVMKPR